MTPLVGNSDLPALPCERVAGASWITRLRSRFRHYRKDPSIKKRGFVLSSMTNPTSTIQKVESDEHNIVSYSAWSSTINVPAPEYLHLKFRMMTRASASTHAPSHICRYQGDGDEPRGVWLCPFFFPSLLCWIKVSSSSQILSPGTIDAGLH